MTQSTNEKYESVPVKPADLDAGQQRLLGPYSIRYEEWPRFHNGPRQDPAPLTTAIARYPDAVLVAGCQRSGTTMLTRLIARSRGFRPLALTHDDELDAALALRGLVDLPSGSRYCLQTTYLNERYPEYSRMLAGQRLIWVVRKPDSVVHSMVHNWRRWALNELYEASRAEAVRRVPSIEAPKRWWRFGPSRAEKARVAYVGKSAQILQIRDIVPAHQLLVVEYDDLVQSPGVWLPLVFEFIGSAWDPSYAQMVRGDSVRKAERMSESMRREVDRVAMPIYLECAALKPTLKGGA